jgi:hypothetical protein
LPADNPKGQTDDRDLLDQAMDYRLVRGTTTRLRRIFGPSCLVTVILFIVISFVFGKWLNLPPVGNIFLLIAMWAAVFAIGVRFRSLKEDDR